MATKNGYILEASGNTIPMIDSGSLRKEETALNSNKLGGKAPEYYVQPRNLLDNSDFRNPVNQRGQTSYNNVEDTIDRWRLYGEGRNSNLTVNDGYISVSFENNGSLYQRIEKGVSDPSKTYTLAIKKYNGDIEVCQASIGYNNNNYFVNVLEIQNGGIINLEWAALYEGSYTAETLPPYVPKGYGVELVACNTAPVELGGGYGGGSLQSYPIGAIYLSINSTSPASLFGGTWEQLKDRFLLGAGSSYSNGATGGAATHMHTTGNHTLTINEMPYHCHETNFAWSADHSDSYIGTANGLTWDSYKWVSNDYLLDINTANYTGGSQPHNHGNTGSSSNLPPYLAVYIWKRIS